jgi:hypothetical protein
MAIAVATPVLPSGLDITTPAVAAALSQTFGNDGKVWLLIKNGSGGTINATFTAQQKVQDGAATPLSVGNRTIAIPTLKSYLAGPFSPSIFNDANSEVTLGFDSITTVTIQALRFTAAPV